MLNKIFLMGRLTCDPELRHTQSGIAAPPSGEFKELPDDGSYLPWSG